MIGQRKAVIYLLGLTSWGLADAKLVFCTQCGPATFRSLDYY